MNKYGGRNTLRVNENRTRTPRWRSLFTVIPMVMGEESR